MCLLACISEMLMRCEAAYAHYTFRAWVQQLSMHAEQPHISSIEEAMAILAASKSSKHGKKHKKDKKHKKGKKEKNHKHSKHKHKS